MAIQVKTKAGQMKKVVIHISFLMLLSTLFSAAEKNEINHKTSNLRLTQLAGQQLFEHKNCISCHNGAGDKNISIKEKRGAEWFDEHIVAESEIVIGKAKSERRKRKYLKKEVEALDDFLFTNTPLLLCSQSLIHFSEKN